MGNPVMRILLTWTAHEMCVVASSEGGLDVISENILSGPDLSIRPTWGINSLPFILSWFCLCDTYRPTKVKNDDKIK